ncbi:MAG: type II toxin-antitoxin system RelE/ParE family toxin [Mariprofundaceae bacterium]|nr:type II toxin-antitoxin system RelE/ParE family toxin [Mariprofundaceae bacterium]
MADKKHYTLTRLAESDLQQARRWSLGRWGKELTRQYFADLHRAAEHAATHWQSLSTREDIAGDTGLCVHPVREHYLVYLPVVNQHIVVVAVIRQSRDVPEILGRAEFIIRREVTGVRESIERGEIKL